jgi:hypothetical protein
MLACAGMTGFAGSEMNSAEQGPTIWCIGLYASASTWAFNLVREMVAQTQPIPAKTFFTAGKLDFGGFAGAGINLVKTHEVDDAETEAQLGRRATKIVITVRDPRDAVTSLMLYHGHTFELALSHVEKTLRLCNKYAPDPRARIFYYESRFFENPETPAGIATHLGLSVPAEAAALAFDKLRRAEVEKHIANLPRLPGVLQSRETGDLLDPATHWHSHHSGRTGEIGRWQHKLDATQRAAIEARLKTLYRFDATAAA